ncbi:hypothetical protein ACHWQZ_G010511 [Mnemiopsis leidyi]
MRWVETNWDVTHKDVTPFSNTRGSTNVVINGYRYTKDKKRDDRTYMKCVLAREGCRARIVLVNGGLRPTSMWLNRSSGGMLPRQINQPSSLSLKRCHFHYSQALLRHMQREDLVPEYQVENSPIRKAFKLIIALHFVPEDLIPTAWRHLKPTLPEDMRTFIDYYEQTWVGTSHSQPLFPHSRWNQHDATALLLLVLRSSRPC